MTGILLHVYHLGVSDWERLVWGDPNRDLLGTGTKLIEYFLEEPFDREIVTIVYSGPSTRDGLLEGAYTKQYLLDNLGRLDQFPRFKERLAQLSSDEANKLRDRIENIVVGEQIANTREEVEYAARYFQQIGAPKVIHIAAASHAPRCIQLQSMARESGLIAVDQQWLTIASDLSFSGTSADDVVIVEPPHRPDDPQIQFGQTLAHALKPYFSLPPEAKQEFVRRAEEVMTEIAKRDQSEPAKTTDKISTEVV